MLQKFSFAGVSAAAIALAAFCPLPAQALSVNWSFVVDSVMGPGGPNFSSSAIGQTFSGTLDSLQDDFYNVSGMTATVTSGPYTPSAGWQPLGFKSAYGGIRASGVQVTNGSIVLTSSSDDFVLESNDFSQSIVMGTRSVLTDGGSGVDVFIGSLSTTFTPVPAPLPLLGLGAAAAFSRKLKQRIALRRKVEVVGAAI